MKKKVIIVLAVVLASMAMLAGCKKDSPNNEKALAVGFDQDFPPMGFVGDDGKYTGFDIELAREAAKRMDMELKLQPINWDSKDMELDSGNIDCIWNGFTISTREDDYTWTEPYMNNRQVLVVKKDAPYKNKEDLKGKVLEVQKDSSAQKALESMPEYMDSVKVSYTSDYNKGFMDLDSGAVDSLLMDEVVASYYIENEDKNFKILDDSLAAEEYGVGFKLGNTKLRDKVQSVLEEMQKDGTMAKISEKWFGKDITTLGK